MRNEVVFQTKRDLNPFTRALKVRCQAEGAVLVRMRNGDYCKVVYRAANPEEFEDEAFHKEDHSAYWEMSGHSVTADRYDLVEFDGAAPAVDVESAAAAFRQACWLHLQLAVTRYLMCNSVGRLDGAEKAHRHMEMCTFYVAAMRGVELDRARRYHEDDYQRVHRHTQKLTDYLDEVIGFPLNARPDYDKLAPKFFDKFHTLALEVL